ncbi:MAG TPA: OB-fold nucleic acid binding domain-containing protein, partial [Dehalococcoidia bacterium]
MASPRPRASAASNALPAQEAAAQLQRILRFELNKGCDDSAVIGGLDRYLERASGDSTVATLLARAPKLTRGYRALNRTARREWIDAVLHPRPQARAAPKKTPAKPAAAPRAERANTATASPDPLQWPVTSIKGVRGATAEKLAKMGVSTIRDLIYLFPNRHNDFADIRSIAELKVGEEQTCAVAVLQAQLVRLGRMFGTEAKVHDGSGTMRIVWFNQTYLAEQLKPNDRIVLAGKVTLNLGQKSMQNPEWERLQGDELTHTGRIVPVYPLTQGLSQRVLRRVVKEAVDKFASLVEEAL